MIRSLNRMVLLTGATGYLGSQIARELAHRGAPFRVLVRDPARAPAKCEVVAGDLLDAEALRKALVGVDRVIHTAALVKVWVRDRREFHRVNVDGLKALVAAAAEAGVRRVVYTSSFIALGPSADANAGEGLRHPGGFSNEYEESKARALEWVRAERFGRAPQLTPGVVEVFNHDWVYSSAKAARELGYRVSPLAEGLRKTLVARGE